MKKLLITSLIAANCAFADKITIRADEWFPVNGEPNSEMPGYMIEIVEKIFNDNGHTIEYKLMPWERSVSMVEKGKFNCVVGSAKDDTPGFVFPKESLGSSSANVYVKKDDTWTFKEVGDLKKIKLGVISGYDYHDEINSYMEEEPKSKLLSILGGNNALEQLIKKVLSGRIQALIEDPMIMEAKLKELELSGELIDKGTLGEKSPLYISCSPNLPTSEGYMKLIDEGLIKMRASGELQKILDKYGLKDWKK